MEAPIDDVSLRFTPMLDIRRSEYSVSSPGTLLFDEDASFVEVARSAVLIVLLVRDRLLTNVSASEYWRHTRTARTECRVPTWSVAVNG